MKKLVVIGLDGADYHLTKKYLKDMPNLRKVVNKGSFLKLGTTIPNISPTAWASFMTGKKPAKHKILGFTSKEFGSPVNSSMLQGPTLWEILSKNGIKSVVFNVPVTYPPEKINGVLISGFPIPKGTKDYTYPKEVAKDLAKQGWDFSDIPAQSFSKKNLAPFFKDLKRRAKERVEATKYLMDTRPWQFFMVHFMETDKVLHEFLNYTRKDFVSRRDYNKYKSKVKEFFVYLDSLLKEIFDRIDPENNLLIVSDHGFVPCRASFYVNTFLLRKGYIKIKKNFIPQLKLTLFNSFLSPIHLFSLLPDELRRKIRQRVDQKYYVMSQKPSLLVKLVRLAKKFAFNYLLLNSTDIDWKTTAAYPMGNACLAEVYINKENPEGKKEIYNKIEKDFKEFRDKNGRKVFDQVISGQKAFGKNEDLADLVAFDSSFEVMPLNHKIFLSNKVLTKNIWFPDRAAHGTDGILITKGPDLKKDSELEEAKIIDMAPTILHLTGLKVPKSMDGRVLKEIFGNETEAKTQEVKEVEWEEEEKQNYQWSEKDKAKARNRLKQMGYI